MKQLLKEIRDNNILLELVDGDLAVFAGDPHPDPSLLDRIKKNKQEIIGFLQSSTLTDPDRKTPSHIPVIPRRPSYPLSSAQRRLWVLCQFPESNTAYNMPGVYRVQGRLETSILQAALNRLTERHDILRTVFREDDQGAIAQWVSLPDEAGTTIVFRDAGPESRQKETIRDLVWREIHTPFDLSSGPLLRVSLYRLAAEEWILVYVMHHIVSDGWSMAVLCGELFQLYNAFLHGEPDPLLPLPIQYSDYSAWQQDQLHNGSLDEHRAWWLSRFQGNIPVLGLPADRPRPIKKTYKGSAISHMISPALAGQVRSLTVEQGATLFMGWLSLVKILLHRYTGEEDIIVGTPVAGRTHPDLEGQIGFYTNTLALRTEFDGKDSFRNVLEKIKQLIIGAFEYQSYPFDQLIDELALHRDMSRNPLFDVMVVLQNNEISGRRVFDEGEGWKMTEYEGDMHAGSKFDLLFSFEQVGEEMILELEYNSDLYDRCTAERIARHIEQLAAAIVADPTRPIRSLDYLTIAEKQQLLNSFNPPMETRHQGDTILDLFDEQVRRIPGKIAVAFEGDVFTYKQLDETSNRLAHYLQSHYPLRPDAVIGIKMERTARYIVCVMGVLKAGAACMPLDPAYPADRLAYMEQDSGRLVTIDDPFYLTFLAEAGRYPSMLPLNRPQPDHLVYLIYTSGSTGRPKASMMPHSAMANLMKFHCESFRGEEPGAVLQFASISFDVSFQEIFSALSQGVALYPIAEHRKKDIRQLTDFIAEKHVTTVFLPTAYFMLLGTEQYFWTGIDNTVRHIIVAGEQLVLSETIIRHLHACRQQLHNHYGPAETHVVTAGHIGGCSPSTLSVRPSIGRPLPNCRIYLLDRHRSLVPVGISGEICIAGEGLSHGYLNNAELTAEKFIADPFCPGERMYRTGDLGRWLPDGTIDFLGRVDDQVKIRGYRIEPAEIEQTLLRHRGVDSAIVALREEPAGEKYLAAWYVSEIQTKPEDLRDYLLGILPEYMVPARLMRLETLPLTPNGKIDKRSLPEPAGHIGEKEYVAPRTQTETKLARIWAEVLDRPADRISITDNFFTLGGHSLKAMKLAGRIHQDLGVRPGLQELLSCPVLEDQAALVLSSGAEVYREIPATPADTSYPLSAAQRRLWMLSRFQEANTAYNMSGAYRLEGDLYEAALWASFRRLIERHESLRTVFREEPSGEVRQYILPTGTDGWKTAAQDIGDWQEEQIRQAVSEEFTKPFDLSTGPLLRVRLLRLGNKKWILTCVLHHIICDGWSLTVMIRDMLKLYRAFLNAATNPLPPLRIQYKDYAVWQNAMLQGEALKIHRAWWLQQFDGELPVLNLPGIGRRPALLTYNGAAFKIDMPADLTKKIKDFCKAREATFFMGLLATIDALLYRYTGNEDIIIGSPMAGRAHLNLEDQIGFYISTLAFRTKLTPVITFRQLLHRIRETTLNVFAHQAYPFDQLVNELNLRRDVSRNPLFDIGLLLMDPLKNSLSIPPIEDLRFSTYDDNVPLASRLDIQFVFHEEEHACHLHVHYNSDIYTSDYIQRMAMHFLDLARITLDNPDSPISRLDFIGGQERQRLLHAFNDTAIPFSPDDTLVRLFEDQAHRTPHAGALVSGQTALTYRELDERSARLAAYLRKNYIVRSDDFVGIMLERSELAIIAMLGVLRSGAAYVPIDPSHPASRREFILTDAGASILITFSHHIPDLDHYKGHIVPIDLLDISGLLEAGPTDPCLATIRPTDLAYVIYTSGSTGQPKGVMVTHGAIANTIQSQQSLFRVAGCARHLQFAALTFDASVSEIFVSLLSGATLYIIGDQEKKDPWAFVAFITNNEIDVATIPPAFLQSLDIDRLRRLRRLITAGEPAIASKAASFISSGDYFNAYGPTETSICATIFSVSRGDRLANEVVPIGRPIANTQIYILDDNRCLAPIGLPGELYVGGAGLAKGYLNRKDLTTDRFVDNPFTPGERLYRTGDMGRWLPDGNIEFTGRSDEQLKWRGYRIEPGEIENALLQKQMVSEAVAMTREDATGNKDLVLYYVPQTPDSDLQEKIRQTLSQLLPAYMIPGHFVPMTKLPLTTSGKIDRRALPDPSGLPLPQGTAFIAPRDAVEEQLAALWREVLGKEKIGIRDDFFTLGGHSLKAIRLIAQIEKIFEAAVDLSELFATSILEEQANLIRKASKRSFDHIPAAPPRQDHPLSSAQYRLWVLSRLGEANVAYNMPGAFVFRGSLDMQALQQAFLNLMTRHEILRTIFVEQEDSTVRQVVLPADAAAFAITFQDIRQQPDMDTLTQKLVRQEFEKPFDLSQPPLLRATLLRTAIDKWIFIFVTHHIISDATSMDILIAELLAMYTANREGRSPHLPPLRIHYKDYAVWQQEQLRAPAMLVHKSYWLSCFEGDLPVLDLSTDHSRPAVRTYDGAVLYQRIPAPVTASLKELTRDCSATLFMGLLSAVNALLFRYTEQPDITIGCPVGGREHADLEGQIGFYVNTLPLRVRFHETDSFKTLLEKVRMVTMNAFAHQTYPFDELIDDLHYLRDMSRSPLFDVVVSLQDTQSGILDGSLPGPLWVSPWSGVTYRTSRFDLSLNFSVTDGELLLGLEYNAGLFKQTTITRLANHLLRLMTTALASPDLPIARLEYLTEEEKHQLLFDFNDTATDFPSHETLASLFAGQVQKTPEKTAVIFGAISLTYRELDRQSDRLACSLIKDFDIHPGDRACTLLDRSEKIIIAILGIIKARATYVPIDPEYPTARKQHIIADTNPRVVITQTDYLFDLEFYTGHLYAIDIQLDTAGTSPDTRAFPGPDDFRARIASLHDTSTPRDLAYIMYTSGSTGKPKGVMVRQKSVIRLVRSNRFLHFTGNEVLLATGAISFDATTFEYWGMLLNGGSLVICSSETLRDPDLLAGEILGKQVDIMWFTAGWLHQLIDTDLSLFQGLKTIVAGGDRLSAVHIGMLRHRYPSLTIINGYGPTENTTFSLTYPIEIPPANIPVGKPIGNSTAYVLDSRSCLLPIGIMGEICVGGEGLAQGYLNDPALTAEKFVPHPFTEGEWLYRTGDKGRWLEDGNIGFAGRMDQQVKINGYRVEPGEIEAALQEYPGIDAAIVMIRTDTGANEKELIACLLGSQPLDMTALREYLRSRLPIYMLPSRYVQSDVFPLTPNGKVDRKALQHSEWTGIPTGPAYTSPRNEKEETLVNIWEQLLQRQPIGIHDNFFEIGGDSIKILRMVSEVRKKMQTTLSIASIYRNSTIAGIATSMLQNDHPGPADETGHPDPYTDITASIERLKTQILSSALLPDPDRIEDIYPMSDIELGMIYESLAGDTTGIYHDQLVHTLAYPNFDPNRFRKALELTTRRHAILRTGFLLIDDNTETPIALKEIQVVYKTISIPFTYTDISALDRPAQETTIEDFLRTERTHPFDVTTAPLWKMIVFQLSVNDIALVFQFHHAILDGWSHASLLTELNNTYLRLDEEPAFCPRDLKSGYRDFILRHLTEKQDRALRDFWYKELDGHVHPDLFTDEDSFGQFVSILDENSLLQLQHVSTEWDIPVAIISLTAYLCLLNLLHDGTEVLTGVVTNTRPDCEDGDRILGCFLNTIPLRMTLDWDLSRWDFVKQVHDKMVALKACERLSLLEIARLHPDEKHAGNAFFDTFFNYVDFHAYRSMRQERLPEIHSDDDAVLPVRGFSRTNSYFDLTVDSTGNSYRSVFTLYKRLRSGLSPQQLGEMYGRILHGIVGDPHRPARMMEYLERDDRRLLLTAFNDTATPYSRHLTITRLFERQAAANPVATALIYQDRRLSYSELNDQSNRLARYLRTHFDIHPDDRIGISLERSADMILAIWGILKAGAAYVPIDPDYPCDRITYITEDSRCKTLIDEPAMERFRSQFDRHSPDNLTGIAGPNDLAYVIYTSGSTGTPKGCAITHGNLMNYIEWATGFYFGRHGAPNFGLFTSLSFDLTVTSIFTTLTTGGELFIYDPKDDLPDILTHMFSDTNRIDSIKLTPSHIDLLQHLDIASSRMAVAIVGGEQVAPAQVLILRRINPDIRIYNEYGPTETTVGCIVHELQPNETVLIGKPIANTRVYILNDWMGLCPRGVTGELYIGGDGLARGYLGKPLLTEERFVTPDWTAGRRLYKTGDLARWLPDGNMEFIGRKDDQIKIRGYRIETGEIETVIRSHPDVTAAAVMAKNGPDRQKEIIAYLSCSRPLTGLDLPAYLGTRLPAFMLPARYIDVEEWPLTPNGKLDRSRLPDPAIGETDDPAAHIGPRNEIEAKLVALWQDLLGKDTIGIKDNFFLSGGNSIAAARLRSLIHKHFQVRLRLKDLLVKTTPEEQARLIASAEKLRFTSLMPLPAQEYYSLSSAQRRIWISSQLPAANVAYNMPGAYIFQGALDLLSLERSFQTLIDRHESLRTVFREDEQGEVRQFIISTEQTGFEMNYFDYRGTENTEALVQTRVNQEFTLPFDLATGPLIRSSIIRVHDDHWVFLYTLHHIISDGWSMQVLIRELLQNYHAFTRGYDGVLQPLRIQYKDYAAWQLQQLTGVAMAGHRTWWLKQFQGDLPRWRLGRNNTRPSTRTYRGGALTRRIPAALTTDLHTLVHRHEATLFIGLLAAVKTVLFQLTGHEDIIVGTPVAGREHIDLEDQIGHYLNTLALRTKLKGSHRFTELLASVKQLTLEAYEHQAYPFDELVDTLKLPHDPSRGMLFDVWIVLHNTASVRIEEVNSLSGLSVSRYGLANDLSVKFDLSFSFLEADGELDTVIEYNRDIVDPKEAAEIADRFLHLLHCITQQPSMTLLQINQRVDQMKETSDLQKAQAMREKNLSRLKNTNQ